MGLVATAIVVSWGVLRSPRYAYDDAYITYRYADNLRRGVGLVYNPGEWVLGTTTPLFALLLGALGLVVPNLEALGHWLGILCWIVAIWAAIAWLWRAGRPRTALAAGLLIALEPSCLPSLGMETHLVIALMLAVACTWLKGRRVLSVFLSAALLLARQDSALWLLLLGLEVWRRRRAMPWREALGAIALTFPWFLYAGLRYGTILPHSALAKLGQNTLMPVGDPEPFWQMLWSTATAGLQPAVVVLSVVVLALGVWVILRSARSFWWLLAWMVAYAAIYTWLGVASFPWYFVPALVVACLVMALGLGYLFGERGTNALGQERGPRRPLLSWLAPVLGGLLMLALLLNRGGYMRAIVANRGYRAAYEQVGQWLANNTSPQSDVASIEIGVIGYLSQRPILDTMGLVSPDMRQHQVGWLETLAYALDAHSPEYVVALPGTAWDDIIDYWWFQEQYETVVGFDEVMVYHRKPESSLVTMPLQFRYADGFTLEGIQVESWAIQPGMALDVRLPVSVQSAPSSRYLWTLFLMDAQTYERPAATTAEPLDGGYGTDRWQAGDSLLLPMRLDLPQDLSPGTYRLVLIVSDLYGGGDLPLADQADVPNPEVRMGWFRYGSPPSATSAVDLETRPLQVAWQDGLELLALGLPAEPLAPGRWRGRTGWNSWPSACLLSPWLPEACCPCSSCGRRPCLPSSRLSRPGTCLFLYIWSIRRERLWPSAIVCPSMVAGPRPSGAWANGYRIPTRSCSRNPCPAASMDCVLVSMMPPAG
ncbi:MAG: hypothetical protein P8129_02595 [Anaerolineae bacterium]